MTLLNDTPDRDYSLKLDRFNRFAEPELRAIIYSLGIQRSDTILDAGCGTGLMTQWLAAHAPLGHTLGIDLSHAHINFARANAPADLPLTYDQADIATFSSDAAFDWIFCSNTIHHLQEPAAILRRLFSLLSPGGTLILGRSTFLTDMIFAWDERLEREVQGACYRYYREKYNLSARAVADTRNYVGWIRTAGGLDVAARTVTIERVAPLSPGDEKYFLEVFFRGYWGQRVEPYLSPEDWRELVALTDPESPRYALRRPDFHHIQTYTLVTARSPR